MSKNQKFFGKAFWDGNGCTKANARAQVSYVRPLSDTLALEFGWWPGLKKDPLSSDCDFVVWIRQQF
jgi:hypothetical protein